MTQAHAQVRVQSLPPGYKPWLIASVVVLVGSLFGLAVAATVAFVLYSEVSTPLWVVVLAVLGALGVAAGFGGLVLLMAAAGWLSFRESRKVQIIPPIHDAE